METIFFFYTSYVEQGRAGLTESQYHMYLDAIVHYGTAGTYEISDPAVEAIFTQVKYSIDASKKRHEKAKRDGAKGGRPSVASGPDMRHYAVMMSRSQPYLDVDQKFLADEYDCSKRTVQRKCSNDFLEMLEKRREKEEEYRIIYERGSSRFKSQGITLNDFVWMNSKPNYYQILFLDTLERNICVREEDVKELAKGRPYTYLLVHSYREGECWADRMEKNILKTGKTPYGDSVKLVEDSNGCRRLKVIARAGEEQDVSAVAESEAIEDGIVKNNLNPNEAQKDDIVEGIKEDDTEKKKDTRIFARYFVRSREVLLYDSFYDFILAGMDGRKNENTIANDLLELKDWIGSFPTPPEHIKKATIKKFQHTWLPSRAFRNFGWDAL